MIVIIHNRHSDYGHTDLFVPEFICDYCEEIIHNPKMALYIWVIPKNTELPDNLRLNLQYVHKGNCCHKLEQELKEDMPDHDVLSMELTKLLNDLGDGNQ